MWYVMPRGDAWGLYDPERHVWDLRVWATEEAAAQAAEPVKPALAIRSRPASTKEPSLHERIQQWLSNNPSACIGDACRHFGITPMEYLTARDKV